MRSGVFLFGVGYALFAFFDSLWWVIAVGMMVKFGLVVDYFTSKFDYKKMKPDLLTSVILGDLVWAVCFAAALWMRFSSQ